MSVFISIQRYNINDVKISNQKVGYLKMQVATDAYR